ncbi:uncharacterized protein LTR77_007070 [Saxophila tyrrhenica]|uniref:Heterokaryon incompatibility domain-containing protein n=1 Tax=Saxophila tyrrhenica TaxID=1690608 RepID=A0AAV9P3Q6_9PEZI|nr:hypothetical protein LTR77_007070 [Saxophila tyrrhenica]
MSMAPNISSAPPGLYRPLDNALKEIRVLHLFPGREDSPVVCGIRTVSLANDKQLPIYDAMSYVWGPSNEGRTAFLHSGGTQYEVPVTDNLHRALRTMRFRRSKSLVIWVDALCTNQNDNHEKSQQVAKMAQVYNKAQCARAMTDRFKDAPRLARQRNWVLIWYGCWDIFNLCIEFLTAKIRNTEYALGTSSRPWHARAWVCQEFYVAQKVVFVSGRTVLKRFHGRAWDDMQRFMVYIGPHEYGLWESWAESLYQWSSMHKVRHKTGSLLHAAIATAGANASDDRDKVYSLIGLMPEDSSLKVEADYDLATWAVYARATFSDIRETSNLLSLEFADYEHAAVKNLPTWTVDFLPSLVLWSLLAYLRCDTIKTPLQPSRNLTCRYSALTLAI